MNKWRVVRVVMSLAMAGLVGWAVSGCAWSIGSDGKTEIKPTKGQELTDLKKAHDQGAINDEEYQAQRSRLLSK